MTIAIIGGGASGMAAALAAAENKDVQVICWSVRQEWAESYRPPAMAAAT